MHAVKARQYLPRVVIFMTAPRAADIPCTDNSLAGLLTFGAATFAEQVLRSCASAGLREIDIVLGHDADCVRACLGDGAAWGLQLRYHQASAGAHHYAVLADLNLQAGERLLLGHAHQWVSERILRALIEHSGVAMHIAHAVSWTGWFSMESAAVAAIQPSMNYASLSRLAAATQPQSCRIARHSEFANPTNAHALLLAQSLPLQDISAASLPPSWQRMPWGAMSPDAIIHPQARIIGPALIGPGCQIARNAQVGPGTVLGRNVQSAEAALLRDSLVLANTHVAAHQLLDHALASGNTQQSLKPTLGRAVNREEMRLSA